MNAFPEDYIVHNVPLILISGLENEPANEYDGSDRSRSLLREGGFRVKIDLPPVNVPIASNLLQSLLQYDTTGDKWNGTNPGSKDYVGNFRIRSVGRTYTLPPRKAPPPPQSPRLGRRNGDDVAPPVLILHSTISPLTPSSPLFPDGIITPLWVSKHQIRLPAVFIACFTLVSDSTTSSLQDNRLKAEIQNLRSVLTSTNYKTKLLIILLGDGAISFAQLDERLATIRRSSGLDAKALEYLPAGASQVETRDFARTLLSSLYPFCIEYYRDLSKHARRKRNRGTLPQPTIAPNTGNSYLLPIQGWNLRYEFKLGVFAEFRQEMDAACRNYESAYEFLFAPEMFEAIGSWSPRFNEARLLADVIAIRIIRCQLWIGQSTGAVRSWINHRDRIRNLLERKGKGTTNYGWEAWQSTWSKTMADIIFKADFRSMSLRDSRYGRNATNFLYPEKALPLGERVAPWEQLHHQGYWLNVSQKHTKIRQKLARQIPEEDRQEPGTSPASLITSKSHQYDSYLTLEPYAEYPIGDRSGFDYTRDIVLKLNSAIETFSESHQLRFTEMLQFQMARQHLSEAAWAEAMPPLQRIWSNRFWRSEGWWKLLAVVGNTLLECASHLNDLETMLRLQWQLSHQMFHLPKDNNLYAHPPFPATDATGIKTSVVINGDATTVPIIASFVFASEEGNVGQPLHAQLCLRSHLRHDSIAITLSEIKIVFEGGLRPIRLTDDAEKVAEHIPLSTTRIVDVSLQDSNTFSDSSKKRSSTGLIASLLGSADLTLGPKDTAIFNFTILPREAGEVEIASITIIVDDEKSSVTQVSSTKVDDAEWWEMQAGVPIPRLFGRERDPSTIKILPKPPLIQVLVRNLEPMYYTGEEIVLDVEVINAEEDEATAICDARLISSVDHVANIRWEDDESQSAASPDQKVPGSIRLPPHDLDIIPTSSSIQTRLIIGNTVNSIDHEVELTVRYVLSSDPDTSLTKTVVFDVSVIRPFESNYNFRMRLHPDPWPNFFEVPETQATHQPLGLKQLYRVEASVHSFSLAPASIEKVTLNQQKITGGAVCQCTPGTRLSSHPETDIAKNKATTEISPDETQIFSFDLTVQKIELGDRQPVAANLQLRIDWRRLESDTLITSVLEVPRFVPPMAEPRVLLTLDSFETSSLQTPGMSIRDLRFTIENPSMHFLTFNVAMEASEDFFFSGPKATTRSLVSVSRHEILYRMMSGKQGQWIGVNLRVLDAYFDKALRVQAAGDGVRSDKKGNVSVWMP